MKKLKNIGLSWIWNWRFQKEEYWPVTYLPFFVFSLAKLVCPHLTVPQQPQSASLFCLVTSKGILMRSSKEANFEKFPSSQSKRYILSQMSMWMLREG